MGDRYKDHIFSEEEILEIIQGFFAQNRELLIGIEEKKQITRIIEAILYAYNEYTKSLMSSGERALHNALSSDFSKIMDKLGVIEEQPRKENIKKFLRAIEINKEIELENTEELINGEYEIDRSEILCDSSHAILHSRPSRTQRSSAGLDGRDGVEKCGLDNM